MAKSLEQIFGGGGMKKRGSKYKNDFVALLAEHFKSIFSLSALLLIQVLCILLEYRLQIIR